MAKTFKKITSLIILVCFAMYPVNVHALPQGEVVQKGSATFDRGTANQLTVNQSTDRLATEWNSFSIGNIETVIFDQPNAGSIALNKVVGADPSQILGTLSANGRVFLINPNGILFGVNANVDVAGLLASTLDLDMTYDEFMAAGNSFSFKDLNTDKGTVVNYGDLSTLNNAGGFIALLGSSVQNLGAITANVGKVILAAGEKMTVALDPAGSISVAIADAVNISDETTKNHDGDYAAVNNRGTITAHGGHVILTAEVLNGIFDNAVNNDGVIEALSLKEGPNGDVLLRSNQDIELNGTIKAAGAIDAYAERNIIIGKDLEDQLYAEYSWEYLGEITRQYQFKEFGYYYDNDGTLLKIVLAQGDDIGRDGSPKTGYGALQLPEEPDGLYTVFNPLKGDWLTWYEDAGLNADGKNHVDIKGTEYWWEDLYNQGDKDFNDAIIDFIATTKEIPAPDALLEASDIFLTANQGYIQQLGGEIHANNLMMEANTGISGTGGNGGIETHVDNVAALNKTSNDLGIYNHGTLQVADLYGNNGLNNGGTGRSGIWNSAPGGEVNVEVVGNDGPGDLNVNAPIDSFGDVILTADGGIMQAEDGNVTVHNPLYTPGAPADLNSPSHQVNVVYLNASPEDRKVDVEWALPDNEPGYGFTATAGAGYTMKEGTRVTTNGGNASITANEDVRLSLVDAHNGDVTVTSETGAIIDEDGMKVPNDYDIIGHTITLDAAVAPKVAGLGDEDELDLGHPFTFSHIWDDCEDTIPDGIADNYREEIAFVDGVGDWKFGTTSDALADGSWWFHVATLDGGKRITKIAFEQESVEIYDLPTSHAGPFIFDTELPPPPPPDDVILPPAQQDFRVYYEILDPSQFLSYEPAQAIGLYAYHPITSADMTAFDDIQLDAGAYDFISDEIEMKKKANPYYGLQ